MTYEIIGIENGDVLARFDDRDEASRSLLSYVDRNRESHPGIEREVALVGLSEDEGMQSEVVLYEDLRRQTRSSVVDPCDWSEEVIQPYLDRELTDAEMREAEGHLDECEYCRTRYRFEQSLRRYVRQVVEPMPQETSSWLRSLADWRSERSRRVR